MNAYSFLIIDDSQPDRYILKRKLQKVYPEKKIFEASDGQQGLDFLSDYESRKKELGGDFLPMVIFLDINMPLVNGFEFLEKFKPIRDSIAEYQSCVLMMFTSSESEQDREAAFSYEFVKDFVVKGKGSADELKLKIDKVLNEKSTNL